MFVLYIESADCLFRRIKAAGGRVYDDRIEGNINLSRAIGIYSISVHMVLLRIVL